jgi:hypothetical protein
MELTLFYFSGRNVVSHIVTSEGCVRELVLAAFKYSSAVERVSFKKVKNQSAIFIAFSD